MKPVIIKKCLEPVILETVTLPVQGVGPIDGTALWIFCCQSERHWGRHWADAAVGGGADASKEALHTSTQPQILYGGVCVNNRGHTEGEIGGFLIGVASWRERVEGVPAF